MTSAFCRRSILWGTVFVAIAIVMVAVRNPVFAQAEIEVDESVPSEVDTNQQQGTDLVAILSKRVLGPIRNGTAVDITLRKPQLFENSILGDRRDQLALLNDRDQFQRNQFQADLEPRLRDCDGLGICRGRLLVVSARLDLKPSFIKEMIDTLDEIGVRSREPRGFTTRDDYDRLRLKLVVNSNKGPPLPKWRELRQWRLEADPNSQPRPERVRLEVLDKDGGTIADHAADSRGFGGHSRIYGPIVFSDLAGDDRIFAKPSAIISQGMMGSASFCIYSGVELFWILNLGDEPTENLGRIRVSIEE